MSDPAEVGLTPGATVAHYRIVRRLGAGGMGEVWLAHDQTLNRQVALKFPAAALLGDPDTRHRLLREARAAAALRHPAVCRVFELGQVEGRDFIAMEYLEGETLGDRLARGPVPPRQALSWGAAIAAALEEAHDKGIVHRDLKPGNVVVTPQGEVKVMDFGLARALPGRGGQADEATMTAGLTAAGMAVGTPGYMAPEQLRGQEVDERADLWALGCVLYQLLTGERAFPGPSVAEAAGATLNLEPDWERLPADTPLEARRLLARCLRKDPGQRLRHAGDARLMLEEALRDEPAPGLAAAAAVAPAERRGWRDPRWAAAALLVVLAGAGGWWLARSSPAAAPRPVEFLLAPPQGTELSTWVEEHALALSPDGRSLAFVAAGDEGSRLFVRSFAELSPALVAGSSGASSPFWSPDGRWLAFFARGQLWKVPAAGGTPSSICPVEGAGTGAWGAGGDIVFTQAHHDARGVYAVPASGGTPRRLYAADELKLDRPAGSLRWPTFLGDRDEFLFHAQSSGGSLLLRGSLEGAPVAQIAELDSKVVWAPPGLLVWSREGTLVAQPCDERGVPDGEAVPVADEVRGFVNGWASFAVSGPQALAVQRGGARARLLWRDRSGGELGVIGELGSFVDDRRAHVRLAADGRRAVVSHVDPAVGSNELWVWDLPRGLASRLTNEPGVKLGGEWTPDGEAVVYTPRHRAAAADLVERRLAGGERVLLPFSGGLIWPQGWHPDGRLVLASLQSGGDSDLLLVSADGRVEPLLATPASETAAAFSPDGRLLAVVSNESGRSEVYLMPAAGGPPHRISSAGATAPRWRRDGRELYYRSRDMLVAVTVDADGTVGEEVELFPLPGAFDVAPDGRFLVIEPEGEVSPPITVMLDWLPPELAQ